MQRLSRRSPHPKHVQIREILRQRIETGVYPPGSQLPPESSFPAQLRVSSTTVSRALNDLAREGLIVRRRRSGSYVTDPTQKPLIAGRHLRFAVLMNHSVVADFQYTDGFYRSVLGGLLDSWTCNPSLTVPAAGESETTRAIWKAPLRGATIEAVGEEMTARRMHPSFEAIREGNYDGLVSMGIVEESFIRQLISLNKPLVLVDYPNDQFSLHADQVYFDPLPGYRMAVQHLVERGARRIHFVGSLMRQPSESFQKFVTDPDRFNPQRGRKDPDSFLRLNACRQALMENGLPHPDAWVHWTWTGRNQMMPLAEKLLALPADQRPDALVCHSTTQAQDLIEILAGRGLPIAATGAAMLGYLGPALPVFASGSWLGRTAASLMIWKLQQPDRLSLRVGVPMKFGAMPHVPETDALIPATLSTRGPQ